MSGQLPRFRGPLVEGPQPDFELTGLAGLVCQPAAVR